MHGPWIQYPLLLALYRYIATWRLSQIQEEKVQSDCCLEFSWHSRPSGPYSERFREASHSLHLSHGWNSMVSSFDFWILWRSRNIMKHLVPLWRVKEKQHEKQWKTHTTKGWAFGMAIPLRRIWKLVDLFWGTHHRYQQHAATVFPDDPTKPLESVTLRFQHLEAANLLLVESLVRHGHGLKK